MEEATKLRESATDVAEAMVEIEGYMQRIKDITVEVSFCPFTLLCSSQTQKYARGSIK